MLFSVIFTPPPNPLFFGLFWPVRWRMFNGKVGINGSRNLRRAFFNRIFNVSYTIAPLLLDFNIDYDMLRKPNKCSILNPILLQTVIKVYLSYRIIIWNFAVGFLFINSWISSRSCVDSYMIEVVNMRLNSLSRFMVLVILLVSPRAIPCPIDHSSIMDSYLSLVYISLPQFPMITSVLPNYW